MTTIALCGLSGEASILAKVPSVRILCGATQRDDLASLIPQTCTALISFGVCGGLSPKLQVSDVVTARCVTMSDGSLVQADYGWGQRLAARVGALFVPMFSSSTEAATDPTARAALLARTGAWASDEETWAVARVATARGLPWTSLRAVSDAWNDTVTATSAATLPSGAPDYRAIAADLLRRPWALAGYARDSIRYQQAAQALSRVVVAGMDTAP